MLFGQKLFELKHFAFGHSREFVLEIFVFVVFLIFAFFVDFQEAFELEHAASGAEYIRCLALAFRLHVDRGLIEQRRIHLRGDEAHPNQAVEFQLVFGQILLHHLRRAENGGGPNGFVGVLRVFLGLIDVRRFGQKAFAVAFGDHAAHFGQGVVGNARGIGTHVGDQTDRRLRRRFPYLHIDLAPASWCA